MRFMSRFVASVLIASTALSLPGCGSKERQDFYDKSTNYTMQDRELGYARDDYRNAFRKRAPAKGDSLDNVPELAPVISQDKKNTLPQPLVSITVNQDVPIRDVFFELAKQAEVDLELDPTITGSLIFTANNRSFDQVVARLCEMSGLRFTFKNNVLRVERDTPYLKTYHASYIGMTRNYTSSIKSNTSASGSSSGGSGGGGGGSSNGATSTIDIKSSNDFWDELSKNLTQLIDSTNQQVVLTDQSAPISAPQAIPAVSQQQLTNVDPQAANNGTAALPNAATTPPGVIPGGVPIDVASGQPVNPAPAAQQAGSSGAGGSTSAPVAGLANPTGTTNSVGAGGAAGGAGGSSAQSTYFSVNKQAGLVTVFATDKQHEKIKTYLDMLLKAVNTQVLIEAKVFEVELNDDNRLGIDWSLIKDDLSFNTSFDTLNFDQAITNPGGIFTLSSGRLDAVVQAISRFGTVRALSSPRLAVLNNETAVLNVSRSRVFFKLTIQNTLGTTTTPAQTNVTSETNSVPEGLIITVHPSVDPDTNEITMNLRPSITRVVNTVADPAVTIAAAQAAAITGNADLANLQTKVPELSVREIDSVVRMNSGRAVLMGGLMQDRAEATQQAIPVLGEIPVIGNLFRSQIDSSKKTEMVIILRATVVNAPTTDDTDKEMYQNMSQDRHPFKL